MWEINDVRTQVGIGFIAYRKFSCYKEEAEQVNCAVTFVIAEVEMSMFKYSKEAIKHAVEASGRLSIKADIKMT